MFQNLRDVAFIGGAYVKGNIKAVAASFHGLSYCAEKRVLDNEELELAAAGVLNVFPYFGPWSWMNADSRRLVDEIIRRVYDEYGLGDDIPLILRGGSMGGHAALNYARYAKRTPVCVACNCPVTDPLYHSTERTDLTRTFLLAYGMGERPIGEVFAENSPMEQAPDMPRVPYFIVHGDDDKAVNKAAHSDAFVARMKEHGHNITYVEAKGMGHGTFVNYDDFRQYMDFVLKFVE